MYSIPVFLLITNSIPLLYYITIFSGSMMINDTFFPSPKLYSPEASVSVDYGLFGIACACILILCIYYVVKAWIMFNKKDF